jgi:hypothetical protein
MVFHRHHQLRERTPRLDWFTADFSHQLYRISVATDPGYNLFGQLGQLKIEMTVSDPGSVGSVKCF